MTTTGSTTQTGGIGESVRRVEDRALLTGSADYAGDLRAERMLQAKIVRSSVAHARIRSVDTSAALASPGTAAVLLADDLKLNPIPLTAMGGHKSDDWARPALASDTVRFVGEMVAVVLADTAAHATDAAELVDIDYEPLPAVIGLEQACDASSTPLFPSFGSNVAVSLPFEGTVPAYRDGESANLPKGTRSVTLQVANHRMAVVPMEPNAITVMPENDGRLTAWVSTQFPHMLRDYLAGALGIVKDQVRVACKAVGGGFGGKGAIEPEYAVIAAAARHAQQPVQYVQTRSENLQTMHGRDHSFTVTLDATDDGVLTDLAVDMTSDVGSYPGGGCFMPMTTRLLAAGPYRVPHVRFDLRCVATNTAPIVPFRGAGRPEAPAMLERALDVLAAELGIEPVEIRRRNFIQPHEFPYESPTGAVYDSGDYEQCLDQALTIAGYDELRREQLRRRGTDTESWLGIGIGSYVEMSAQGFMAEEFASVRIEATGDVQVLVGTQNHGQGHATVFAQVATEVLGVPIERISVVDSDTDLVPSGRGTASSRSAQIAGSAVKVAAEAVLEQARLLAAQELEAAADDLVVVPGVGICVAGDDASVLPWARLAAIAGEPGLVAAPGFSQDGGTAPFGCHVAVVEVDRDTGAVRLTRMVAVDDCGTVLNPLLADGQVHGGVFAGIAQALFEEMRYDNDGNPLTATLADYAMPSAADLPSYETARTVTPSPKNPLGAKGLGEAGTCGALVAVHNAVVDAVAHLGIRHIDLPLAPERVWRAISQAPAAL